MYVVGLRVVLVLIITNKQVKQSTLQPKQLRQIREFPGPFENTTPSRCFQIEGIVILLNRFLNLKWSLFEKRSIFYFPRVDFSKALYKLSEILFRKWTPYLQRPFLLYFQVQRDNTYSCVIFLFLVSNCRYTILLQKAARRVFRTRLLECRKASFISATKLIVSFSQPTRIQICRLADYE